MGADVVKVEPPEGDSTRRVARAAAGLPRRQPQQALAGARPQVGGAPGGLPPAGRATPTSCSRTTAPAWRRGSAPDWETLSELNPRLIYASVSGFGQTGPYAQRPGYDLIAQGLSGVMSVTGEPGGDPVKCGIPIGDLSAGLFCAVAILSRGGRARAHRPRASGSTRRCSRARWRCRSGRRPSCGRTGRVPQPLGSAHRLTAPYQALRTARRAHHGRRQQPAAVAAAVRGDRAARSWSRTRASRPTTTGWRNRPELAAELEAALDRARRPTSGSTTLVEAGVPCGPIHDYRQVFEDPHTQAREMEVRLSIRSRARSARSASR